MFFLQHVDFSCISQQRVDFVTVTNIPNTAHFIPFSSLRGVPGSGASPTPPKKHSPKHVLVGYALLSILDPGNLESVVPGFPLFLRQNFGHCLLRP